MKPKWKGSSVFGSLRYGIDVPLVNPYIHAVETSELPIDIVRPLRADARRNREAILAAAKIVFARCGADAQMDDIAKKAKVGVGTVYRHFPNKEALVLALVADRFEQIAGFIIEGLDDPDPFHALCRAMERGAELAASDRGLSALFAQQSREVLETAKCRADMFAAGEELVRRAKASGQLRPDFEFADIGVLMCGVTNAMHQLAPDARTPGPWRRHLQIVLDGMRARAATEPLPDEGGAAG